MTLPGHSLYLKINMVHDYLLRNLYKDFKMFTVKFTITVLSPKSHPMLMSDSRNVTTRLFLNCWPVPNPLGIKIVIDWLKTPYLWGWYRSKFDGWTTTTCVSNLLYTLSCVLCHKRGMSILIILIGIFVSIIILYHFY